MKTFYSNINDELLVKYLLRESTKAENSKVEDWLQADNANQKYFDHFKLLWDKSRELAAKTTVDEDAAWQRFQQRIHETKPQQAIVRSIHEKFSWIRVAAIFLITISACLGGWYIWYTMQPVKQIAAITNNKTLTDTLPDGSVVTLNKHSELSYPERFKGDTRKVALKGEAFFEVKPNGKKPFIITVNDITVTVVGTSFNIKSDGVNTEVVVETGIVKVTRNNKTIELRPKQKAVVDAGDSSLQPVEEKGKLYNYYRTQTFVCDETPLWQLVEVLKEAYGVDIIIARKEIRSLPLTTTFNEETLDHVLEIVAKTLDITVEKNNGQIILK